MRKFNIKAQIHKLYTQRATLISVNSFMFSVIMIVMSTLMGSIMYQNDRGVLSMYCKVIDSVTIEITSSI